MIDTLPFRKRSRWTAACTIVSAFFMSATQTVAAIAAQTAPPAPSVTTPAVATVAVNSPKVLWHVVPYHPQGGEDGEDGKVAMDAFKRGDYDLAIAAFSYSLQVRPKFADASYNLGLCFEAVKDYDRAATAFAAVIRMKPKLIDAYVELGRTYLLKGDPVKAREIADAALKLNPKNEDAIALDTDVAAATKVAQLAAPSSPTSVPPASATPPKALWHVVPYHPSGGGAEGEDLNDGIRAYSNGDYDLAIAAFSYQLKIRPKFYDASFNLGLCFEAVKDYDRAVAAFTAAIQSRPKVFYAYVELGRTYLLMGDLVKARANADIALNIKPKDEDVIALSTDVAAASKIRK